MDDFRRMVPPDGEADVNGFKIRKVRALFSQSRTGRNVFAFPGGAAGGTVPVQILIGVRTEGLYFIKVSAYGFSKSFCKPPGGAGGRKISDERFGHFRTSDNMNKVVSEGGPHQKKAALFSKFLQRMISLLVVNN